MRHPFIAAALSLGLLAIPSTAFAHDLGGNGCGHSGGHSAPTPTTTVTTTPTPPVVVGPTGPAGPQGQSGSAGAPGTASVVTQTIVVTVAAPVQPYAQLEQLGKVLHRTGATYHAQTQLILPVGDTADLSAGWWKHTAKGYVLQRSATAPLSAGLFVARGWAIRIRAEVRKAGVVVATSGVITRLG